MGEGAAKTFAGQLLNYLKDPNIGVIKHTGYKGGMGRWSTVKQAAEMAMESHLFDILIWLKLSKEEQRPGNLQKKIAELLGIEFSTVKNGLEDNESEDIAMAIHDKLKNKRFLLVLGDVSDLIDLTLVGVPSTLKTGQKMRTASVSKVVYVTTLEGEDFNIQYDTDFSFEITYINFGRTVVEEAVDAAHSLKRSTGSYLATDTVLDFLMYLMYLFDLVYNSVNEVDKPYVRKRLLRYSMAQGFVTNSTPIAGDRQGRGGMNEDKTTEEEMILSERMMEPLFEELYERSFIGENYELPYHIRNTLKYSHKHWIGKGSLPKKIDDFVAIAIAIDEKYNHLPPSPIWRNITALFIACEKEHPCEFDIPPTFFENMQCLRVLELHFTPITSVPSSLSSLSNLRLLWLQCCQKLTILPTSLQYGLEKLEFLELSECTSLQTMPEHTFKLMSNLRHLELSKSNIMSLPCSVSSLTSLQLLVLASCKSLVEIPEKSFENMQHLEVLDLSNSSSFKSLPSSLSNLVGLKQLHLKSCSSLKTGLGVLKNLSSLEVLDLSYCCAMEDIQDLSFGVLVPNIKCLDLSGLTIPKRLSFRGCQRLVNLKLDDKGKP